ncbi:MAG: ATP-binding protein [Thermodesulfobacteriota bacterium]
MDVVNEENRVTMVQGRISQKAADYEWYHFTKEQSVIIKTFFDLAQEFESQDDFFLLCVLILTQSMDVTCRLYLVDKEGELQLFRASDELANDEPRPAPDVPLEPEIVDQGNRLLLPIYDGMWWNAVNPLVPMGMFEVVGGADFSDQEKFFLGKFVNRLGVVLGHRLVSEQNVQHIAFISSLVTDIEHNVIIPNMYFKHLFNKLRKKITDMEKLQAQIRVMKNSLGTMAGDACQTIIDHSRTLQKSLSDYHHEMQRHHDSCSLFLESLFRRDHFEQGELVLRAKRCLVEAEIITPQLEHYEKRLLDRGVAIERPGDMVDEEIPLNVDVGLLAQVYANLFSNAVKYAAPVTLADGTVRQAVTYGREFVADCFGPGQDGVKFNVFTTGFHLPPAEAAHIFEEGYRADNSGGQAGSGHGLSFIKQVVEIHGGLVSYEPTRQGNNFCFFLPLPEDSC